MSSSALLEALKNIGQWQDGFDSVGMVGEQIGAPIVVGGLDTNLTETLSIPIAAGYGIGVMRKVLDSELGLSSRLVVKQELHDLSLSHRINRSLLRMCIKIGDRRVSLDVDFDSEGMHFWLYQGVLDLAVESEMKMLALIEKAVETSSRAITRGMSIAEVVKRSVGQHYDWAQDVEHIAKSGPYTQVFRIGEKYAVKTVMGPGRVYQGHASNNAAIENLAALQLAPGIEKVVGVKYCAPIVASQFAALYPLLHGDPKQIQAPKGRVIQRTSPVRGIEISADSKLQAMLGSDGDYYLFDLVNVDKREEICKFHGRLAALVDALRYSGNWAKLYG